jgi:hypothetical protein
MNGERRRRGGWQRRSIDRETEQEASDASDDSVSAKGFWQRNPSGKRPGFWRRLFGRSG